MCAAGYNKMRAGIMGYKDGAITVVIATISKSSNNKRTSYYSLSVTWLTSSICHFLFLFKIYVNQGENI